MADTVRVVTSAAGVYTVEVANNNIIVPATVHGGTANNAITNAMLAQVATATFKGRHTAATGNVEDLTAAQAAALMPAMAGDSGAGGTIGMCPAPAAGDGTYKFLKADGTWHAVQIARRSIIHGSASHVAGKVAGTYALSPGGNPAAVSGTGTLFPQTLWYNSGGYTSAVGLTPALCIKAHCLVNDVAPTGNFTFGLYPVTRPATSGGAALNILTLGTVVTGSNDAVFTAPAADSMAVAVSSSFAVPAVGWYTIGVVTSATVAVSSLVWLYAELELFNA